MYKLLLILKYLRKRRIAWVSLIAVTLCTALVIVVISVMGGWLRMFRESFKGLSGDVLVESRGLSGFSGYEEMIAQIRKLPDVEGAVPVLQSFGLLKISVGDPVGVQVLGYPMDQIGTVNEFPKSLYRQYYGILDAREKLKTEKNLPPDEQAALEQMAAQEIKPPTFKPFLPPDQYEMPNVDERVQEKLANSPGMIVGVGVVGIHKNEKGEMVDRYPRMYRIPTALTLMDMSSKGPISAANAKTTQYWIVDDSRTKVYQVDENTVYVPFDQLQKDLGLTARTVTLADGTKDTIPARTSEIHVKVKPGADLMKVRDEVEKIVEHVVQSSRNGLVSLLSDEPPRVQTWEQKQSKFLGAVEKEMVLVTVLFALISVVAVFLIFCIFYMIVVEKTKDIGIVKSVGATSGGVAQIFLGYGLAIGLLGGGFGLIAGYAIVHNINWLHTEMGRLMGVQMWDPEVYAFDTIPNTMNPKHVAIIVAVAIFASVLGALVPAYRAARMNPVEALRWE